MLNGMVEGGTTGSNGYPYMNIYNPSHHTNDFLECSKCFLGVFYHYYIN